MNTSPFNSGFYIGHVFHKRYQPKIHQFRYPLYMIALDLDEIEKLNKRYWWFSTQRWAPLQFKISDYLSYSNDLAPAYQQDKPVSCQDFKHRVFATAEKLGANINHLDRVMMLAQLRCFGVYFSPVNFFFLYLGNQCRYLLAEVSNTPWNKKHCYLIDLKNPKPNQKDFHVSPFMNLDMEYRWKITPPEESTSISIENWSNKCLFKADFAARRFEISQTSALKMIGKFPVSTLSILRKIYWQALRLFIKGVKYVPYQTRRQQ